MSLGRDGAAVDVSENGGPQVGVDVAYGTRLRSRRSAAGLTQIELAERSGCTKSWLSKIETGKARPTPELLQRLDAALRTFEAAPPRTTASSAAASAVASGRASGLPGDTAHFVGRRAELQVVTEMLLASTVGGSPVVCVVDGMAGVGKTAFAVRLARRLASRSDYRCLFLDLHGFTGSVPPVPPADALDRLLRRTGMAGEAIPQHVDDRADAFRAHVAGRTLLLILDNAADAAQVRPLLPASSSCRVLVTSRLRLTSLDDAEHVTLHPLPAHEAATLFRSVAGRGGPSASPAVDRVVELCGGLPLALRIAAARTGSGGVSTVVDLARRMDDEHERAEELDDGERSVVSAFTTSFEALPVAAQRAFALLGLFPGAEWDRYAAGALFGVPTQRAARLLDQLATANMVDVREAGRYQFHDLVRDYARKVAAASTVAQTAGQEHREAVRRLFAYYLHTAERADLYVTPHRHRPPLRLALGATAVPAVRDYAEALSWFAAERATLVALCRFASSPPGRAAGGDDFCCQLAYILRGVYFLRKLWDDWLQTHRLALAAARRSSNVSDEAFTLNNLGLAYLGQRDFDRAGRRYRKALQLFEQAGDQRGRANAIANLAAVSCSQGDFVGALAGRHEALAYYRLSGNLRNAAITLRSMASTEIEHGRAEDAVRYLHEALDIFVDLGLLLDATMTRNRLGEAHLRAGDAAQASYWARQAIQSGIACDSAYEQARGHVLLGGVAADQHDAATAAEHWRLALGRYESLQAPESDVVRRLLAEVS